MLQSWRRPRNTDFMLHAALFKGSNCGVADAVIVIFACVLITAKTNKMFHNGNPHNTCKITV